MSHSETIYKNDFIKQATPVCPAKVMLESKDQGKFFQSRANFSENTDFKALNPEFHAISTSPHTCV